MYDHLNIHAINKLINMYWPVTLVQLFWFGLCIDNGCLTFQNLMCMFD